MFGPTAASSALRLNLRIAGDIGFQAYAAEVLTRRVTVSILLSVQQHHSLGRIAVDGSHGLVRQVGLLHGGDFFRRELQIQRSRSVVKMPAFVAPMIGEATPLTHCQAMATRAIGTLCRSATLCTRPIMVRSLSSAGRTCRARPCRWRCAGCRLSRWDVSDGRRPGGCRA